MVGDGDWESVPLTAGESSVQEGLPGGNHAGCCGGVVAEPEEAAKLPEAPVHGLSSNYPIYWLQYYVYKDDRQ